jgi:NAD(P)H-flavin reductase
MLFVIKNYNQPNSLSASIHSEQGLNYEVKGPMGKSLNVASSGLHIAFAGGTGVLPFIDLVG